MVGPLGASIVAPCPIFVDPGVGCLKKGAILVSSALFFAPGFPWGSTRIVMKAEIHPKYEVITARCSCGNEIKTRSTLAQDITIDVCSRCHPFFTGKQKIVDSGGRVDRFNKRFAGRSLKK